MKNPDDLSNASVERLMADIGLPRKYAAEAMEQIKTIHNCIVCNVPLAEQSVIGFFLPSEDYGKQVGFTKEHGKLFLYGLCDTCYDREDIELEIERLVLKKCRVH